MHQAELDKILHEYTSNKNKVNEQAIKIVSNPIYDDTTNITVDGIVKELLFDDRYYLHTVPKDTNKTYDLIVFYHGSRDIAWTQILEYTTLCEIDKDNYIIAFGQASGTISKPEIHPEFG